MQNQPDNKDAAAEVSQTEPPAAKGRLSGKAEKLSRALKSNLLRRKMAGTRKSYTDV